MTPEEQRTYQEWFQTAKPQLEAKQWADAMKDVPQLPNLEPAQPRPLSKPLSECTVALVTSAAVTAPGQEPMDGANIEGDYTIRIIDIDEPLSGLRVWHTHFDTAAAEEDINVVYPIEALKSLADEGFIGKVAPQAVSFMGYFSNVFRLRDDVIPAVVSAVDQSGAHAALMVPV